MNRILMAVDGSTDAGSILSVYRSLVRRPEQVVLIQVHQSARRSPAMAPGREQGPRQAGPSDDRSDRIMQFFEQVLAGNDQVAVKTVMRCGEPSDVILDIAREEQVDLIIMGDERRPLLRAFGKRCVVESVERRTAVPVLVAKCSRREKSNEMDWKEKNAYAA